MDRRAFLKSTGLTTVAGLAAMGVTGSTSLAGTDLSSQARILLLSVPEPEPTPELDTGLSARRIAEGFEAVTDGRIQIVAAPDTRNAGLTLAPVSVLIARNRAWTALMPMVHGLGPQAFDGWLLAGGGMALIGELAHDTQMIAFPIARSAAPQGFELCGTDNGGALAVTPDVRGLRGAESHSKFYCLRSGYDETPYFPLPHPLAGEPVFLAIHTDAAQALSSADRSALKAIAAAEYGAVAAEADVQTALRASVGPDQHPMDFPSGFSSRYAAAVATLGNSIAAHSDIGRQIIESQRGYRAMTTGKPLDRTATSLVA